MNDHYHYASAADDNEVESLKRDVSSLEAGNRQLTDKVQALEGKVQALEGKAEWWVEAHHRLQGQVVRLGQLLNSTEGTL